MYIIYRPHEVGADSLRMLESKIIPLEALTYLIIPKFEPISYNSICICVILSSAASLPGHKFQS